MKEELYLEYILIYHLQFSDEKLRTPISNCTEVFKKKKNLLKKGIEIAYNIKNYQLQ